MRRRGYTAVELLMSVAVLAIGISGVIAMQKITVVSNQHAKNLALATHIAQSWLAELTADAAGWNHPSARRAVADLGDTVWLREVNQRNGEWFQPSHSAARAFGPAFDALGNVVDPGREPQQVRFCTHLRLRQLYPDTLGVGLIRAEVRVFWSRDGQGTIDGRPLCTSQGNEAAIGRAIDNYHFVYQTTAIAQQTLP